MVNQVFRLPDIQQTTRMPHASVLAGTDLVDHEAQTLGTVVDL